MSNEMIFVVGIDEALSLYPTQQALADALGVTKASISKWKKRGGAIPEHHAARLIYALQPRAFIGKATAA